MYDPTGLTVLVLFGVVILVLQIVAIRTGANAPVLLTLSGVALAFVPTTAELQVPPELVVLLFLPALLYRESLTTSLQEIHASGVLAVIVCGLAISRVGPRVISARTRVQSYAYGRSRRSCSTPGCSSSSASSCRARSRRCRRARSARRSRRRCSSPPWSSPPVSPGTTRCPT